MTTVLEQLLRLKEYPAKLLIGRATESGVMVLEDKTRLERESDAVQRVQHYEGINNGHLQYRYEVVPLADVESMIIRMKLALQVEAKEKGLPMEDWK